MFEWVLWDSRLWALSFQHRLHWQITSLRVLCEVLLWPELVLQSLGKVPHPFSRGCLQWVKGKKGWQENETTGGGWVFTQANLYPKRFFKEKLQTHLFTWILFCFLLLYLLLTPPRLAMIYPVLHRFCVFHNYYKKFSRIHLPALQSPSTCLQQFAPMQHLKFVCWGKNKTKKQSNCLCI